MKAFSFLEVTIVLSAISLLLIVVIFAKNLKSYSNAVALGSDVINLKTAFIDFNSKYEALPGDMVDAYNIWGSMCAETSADCNGDGDMQIDSDEKNMALVHLALDGLLAYGNISTNYYNLSYPALADIYYKDATATVSGRSFYNAVLEKNIIEVADGTSRNPFISSQMAQKIDYKFDDGLPKTGDVTVVKQSSNICLDETNNIYLDNLDGATASASDFECSFAIPITN